MSFLDVRKNYLAPHHISGARRCSPSLVNFFKIALIVAESRMKVNPGVSALLYSRLQLGVDIAYHLLFPAISLYRPKELLIGSIDCMYRRVCGD